MTVSNSLLQGFFFSVYCKSYFPLRILFFIYCKSPKAIYLYAWRFFFAVFFAVSYFPLRIFFCQYSCNELGFFLAAMSIAISLLGFFFADDNLFMR